MRNIIIDDLVFNVTLDISSDAWWIKYKVNYIASLRL